MNRLEQMYARLEKHKFLPLKENQKATKEKIKTLEKIALKFQACADLTLLQAKQLKEKL